MEKQHSNQVSTSGVQTEPSSAFGVRNTALSVQAVKALEQRNRNRRLELKRQIIPILQKRKETRTQEDRQLVAQFREWNKQTRREFLQQIECLPPELRTPKQARMLRRFREQVLEKEGRGRGPVRGKKPNRSKRVQHSGSNDMTGVVEVAWTRSPPIRGRRQAKGSSKKKSNGEGMSSLASLYQSMERLGISQSPAPIPGLQSMAFDSGDGQDGGDGTTTSMMTT